MFRRGFRLILSLTVILFLLTPLAKAGQPVVVNTHIDTVLDDEFCSITEAITAAATKTAANGCPAGKGQTPIVTFDLPNLPATIFLNSTPGQERRFIIGADLSIEGPGTDQLILDAGGTHGHFEVNGFNLSISGLSLANGNPPNKSGGAIKVTESGLLNLSDCIINDNQVGGVRRGGAILIEDSSATINKCILYDNSASFGGAIAVRANDGNAVVEINSTSFFSNTSFNGGAVSIVSFDGYTATTLIDKSIFSSNHANGGVGGAIYNDAHGDLSTDTTTSTTTVTKSTIAANDATASSGGIHNTSFLGTANMTVSNSIVINNTGQGPDSGEDIQSEELIAIGTTNME